MNDALSVFSSQVVESLLVNWPWAVLTLAVALALIGGLWRVLPHQVERFLKWLDSLVPGDFSALYRPVSRTLMLIISAVVLFAAGVIVAGVVGMDTSDLVRALRSLGAEAGQWLLDRLLRVALIVGLAAATVRLSNHVLPRLISHYLSRRAGDSTDAGEAEKRAKTLEGVMVKTVNTLVIVATVLLLLLEAGFNITPLLAGVGVAGIAIGFAAQNLIRDVLNGLFIILEDQYRVGDVVTVAGIGGLVEDINLRRTVLRDLEFTVHTIPNGEIRTVSNRTKEKSRAMLDIQVAYKEDLDRVIGILNRVGAEMYEDPAFGPLMSEPLKVLRVDGFLDSGISIRVLGETKPIQQWNVMGEFRRRIKRVFDNEGIEIPFPHRTLYWGTNQETRVRTVAEHPGAGAPPQDSAQRRQG